MALACFRETKRSWTKSDGSPVSETDLLIDGFLRERLLGARPDYGWLSEETSDDLARLGKRRLWLVDPIDGTSAFLGGTDHWSIAVALIEDGRPVAASVLRPVTGEHYRATKARGALLNGRSIRVSARRELKGARMVAHRKMLRPERWREPWPEINAGMSTSLALRLCLVASGEYDCALATGRKSDWDLAAGDLIVHEAGGRVSDLAGQTMAYNRSETRQHGLVAAGPGLMDQMLRQAAGYRVK